MTTSFHLDKSNAKLFGVCVGFADYTGLDPLIVRIAVVLATLCGVGSMILVYLLVALVANDRAY